ncbi:polymeric immunoglobulin receptor-like protein [Labeo rohita]|nr:polymeric immunoglobulin receptor-like protein [Labeo rohita]
MKIIWTFTLLMIPGVVSSISVTGYSGGGVIITCKYDRKYTANAKYFCRGQWSECINKIRTNNKNEWFDDGRFSLFDDTSAAVFTVIIRDLCEQDSGMYQCASDISWSKDPYIKVNLNIIIADCCEKSISLSAAAGGSVNISCKYPQSHSADVKFVCRRSGSDLCAEETSVKENRRWSAEGQIQLYDDREQQLLTGTISHVTQQHSAEYWCGVQSDQGHKSFITRVLINFTDVVSSISVTGYSGGGVIITCKCDKGDTGYKKYFCRGQWSKCTDKIKTKKKNKWFHSGRFSLYYDTRATVFTVTIRDLSEQDSDIYYCGTERTGYDLYTEVNLNVITADCCEKSISLSAAAGGSVNISCKYPQSRRADVKFVCRRSGSDLCAEETSVKENRRWSAEGQIQLYDDREQQLLTGTISHVTQQHSAEYWCGVQSDQGHKSFITRVLINVTGFSLIIPLILVPLVLIIGHLLFLFLCKKHQSRGSDSSSQAGAGKHDLDSHTGCDYEEIKNTHRQLPTNPSVSSDCVYATVHKVTGDPQILISSADDMNYAMIVRNQLIGGHPNQVSRTTRTLNVTNSDNEVNTLFYRNLWETDLEAEARRRDLREWRTRKTSTKISIQLYDDREQQLLTGTISHVTQQHSAEYWCGVQSDQGHKSFITRVLINVTGVVSSISVTGYSGGGVIITCRYYEGYTGFIKYFCRGWSKCTDQIKTKDNNKWVHSGSFSLYYDTRAAVFTVTIRDLSKQDSDTYYCGVERSGQDLYTKVNLNVSTADCCEKSISLSAAAGGSVNISCKYPQSHSADVKFVCRRSGSDLCAEETSVKENRRWSAEGQIQLYDDREQQLLTGTISHVTQQHSAEYWCGVQSDQGHKSFITRVLINITGTGVVSSISVTGYSGGGVIITCGYYEGHTGYIKYFCRGWWSKYTYLIKTKDNNKWVHSGRFSLYYDTRAAVFTVTIRNLSEQDSGTYYCGVERSGQDLYTKVNLNVITDEKIRTMTGYSGGNVIINYKYKIDLDLNDSGKYYIIVKVSEDYSFFSEFNLDIRDADCCEKSISLSAAAGGSVNISCKYPQSHSADVKFVCRRSGSDLCAEETSVKENRRWSAEGQIQLYDDREQQLLMGTISHVTQQHSAEYWCGVQSDQGQKSFITRVLINVTNGDLSSQAGAGKHEVASNTDCVYEEIKDTHRQLPTNPSDVSNCVYAAVHKPPGDSQVVITSADDLNYAVVNFQKKADCPDSVSLRNNQDYSEYAAVSHHTA